MQITVRMPNEYGNKLDKLSKELGMRRSDIIRLAMKRFLEATDQTDRQSPYLKVSHLLGIAESDVNDLGQSHRKYLIHKGLSPFCPDSPLLSRSRPLLFSSTDARLIK